MIIPIKARPIGKSEIANIDKIINSILVSFPFQPIVLNFKLKIGISATSKKDKTQRFENKSGSVKSHELSPILLFYMVNKSPRLNMVQAGVFNPIKSSVCL